MSVGYVDASALTAIAFQEPSGPAVSRQLAGLSTLVSSNLLEAELRAACAREQRAFEPEVLDRVEWVLPGRPLTRELEAAAEAGYLRGADLWHVASALYFSEDPRLITFVTLDRRQAEVAAALGFQT